jgi:hypothetical protein
MDEWFNLNTAIYFGAGGGAFVGILGGLLGTLTGLWAPKGLHKAFLLGTYKLLRLVGAVALVAGVVALVQKQPYHVYYPLLLLGLILLVVMSGVLPGVKRQYEAAEQRKLQAEDFRSES